ncbi:MAG: hypothetical protein KC766_20040 [Myxococcales bacterium]|nr:hypothetical protein [Myxococcales bacterium]
MHTTLRFLAGALLASTALMGCSEETVSSTNIKTKGIAGLFEVTASSDTSSTVNAKLVVGGDESNTYVTLDNGDKLTATAGDETKTMTTGDGPGRYEASFANGAGGTEFKISLERPDDDDAPNSVGTLPAPFNVTEVPNTTPSRASDAITIKWDDGNGDMKIEVEGDCIFSNSFKAATGSTEYTIKAGEIDSTGVNPEDEETCDLTLTLTRTNTGNADTANLDDESYFKLYQVRKTKFASAP